MNKERRQDFEKELEGNENKFPLISRLAVSTETDVKSFEIFEEQLQFTIIIKITIFNSQHD